MKPPVIDFDENYNKKLDCQVFTTIRGATQEEEEHFMSLFGKIFDIHLRGEIYCKAKLVEESVYPFERLPLPFLYLDTGLTVMGDVSRLFKRFGVGMGDNAIVLVFRNEETK